MEDRYAVEPDIDHPEEFPKTFKGLEAAMSRALTLSLSCGQQRVVAYESGVVTVRHIYENGKRI